MAPEKPKLDLGTFSFCDADRQKLAVLPKKGLPEKTNTVEAQMALLDVLDSVMNTAMAKARTAKVWNFPDGNAGKSFRSCHTD